MSLPDPQFLSLCDKVVLLVWSLPGEVDGPATLSGPFEDVIAPLSALKLRAEHGGTRVVWALPRPAEEAATLLIAAGGHGSTSVVYRRSSAPEVAAALFDGLTPAGRMSLTSALLGSWPNLFRLKTDRGFIAALLRLFPVPSSPKSRLQPMFVAGGRCFFELVAPRQLGAPKSSYMVYRDRIEDVRLSGLSGRKADAETGVRRFHCDDPADTPPELILIRFENGFAVRDWPQNARMPRMERWWSSAGRDVGLREECLDILNASGELGRAASREFQLRCPLKQSAVAGGPDLPSARIELALAGASGMLVGGWYRDPAGFVSGFDVLDPLDRPHSFDSRRFDFAGKVPGPNDTQLEGTGFVAYVPGVTGPRQQPRFLLRLRSGVQHLLVPAVQPIDWPASRAAALRAVPPQHLTDKVISSALAPMLAECQTAAQRSIGAPAITRIGTPVEAPDVSIVVPLYRVLDFLPFQIAAFASDPQILFRCELIYVLDSPEQAAVVEHMLTGLHLVYGIPITLAVMPRSGGFSMANNRAVVSARAPVVALVNSDVVPVRSGWVGMLEQRLRIEGVGAVGPKLLFEDDSIQHAGLYFAQDHRGRWLNHHYFKGMPRHYAPATRERSVPGITGACMVMRRSVFDAVGGLTEDYVIGDYEDSDLCLKIRGQGLDILYVPEAELYHLERRSMNENADYMRGVASQYNSWLHQQRWGEAMTELMADARVPVSRPARNVA